MDGGEPLNVVGVPSERFQEILPSLTWHFDSFEERSHGEATASDLAQEVIHGTRQCWVVWDGTIRACALTQVLDSGIRAVEITHCAGQGRGDWQQPIVEEILRWAEHIGAKRFRAVCRPGWARFLRDMGLRETHRVMEKNLG